MNARVKELFHELADLPENARAQYFSEHEVDAETRSAVEELLAFDSGASTFLMHDVSVAASRSLSQLDPKGWRCGPYRLLNVIGRGGMGAVYLAERADGEVTQRVAVKLLPPGADDPQRERFLQERQILALLAHPNIARMMDAGHLENGQPFLAMEYIDGKPIDVFAAGLSVRQKITLFLRVCAAVSYLHRNLVVHRDLKPSNILVTSEGEPKLLDFGIAKMLDMATDSTITSMRMLTPDYASPEQVMGGRASTATDIYSLGAVLYKLLTGEPAHEFENHSPEAIAQVVTSREVARPSKRATELKGDVDFILLKALRKDPQERYATVEQFAEDLEAFLESRPVKARSGNAWYRTRKFVRHYWIPVGAAALVIVSLSVGLYAANRQRAAAQRRFGQLRQLSGKVFDLDKAIRNLPGSTEARQRLVSASMEYLEGLASDAHGDLDLAQEMAAAYERVASIQGVPTELNLGEFARAEGSLKKADALIETVLASRRKSPGALLSSAQISHDRMILAVEEDRRVDALAHARKAAERLEVLLLLGNLAEGEKFNAAGIYSNIAFVHVNMHLYQDAIAYARRTVEIARAIPSGRRHVGFGLSVLANALRCQGDLEAALQAIREAREIAENTPYASDTLRMIAMDSVLLVEGLILGEDGGLSLGRRPEAIDALQRAFDLTEGVARKAPNDYASRSREANIGDVLGGVLRNRDPQRALAVYDLSIQRLAEAKNNLTASRDQAKVLANSSYALRRLHRSADAKQRIDAALGILMETKDYPTDRIRLNREVDIALSALADYEAEQERPRSAVEIYQQLLDKVIAAEPHPLDDLRDAPRMSRLYEALTGLYSRTGDTAKAEGMELRRLELWRHWDRKLPNNRFVLRQLAAAQAR